MEDALLRKRRKSEKEEEKIKFCLLGGMLRCGGFGCIYWERDRGV